MPETTGALPPAVACPIPKRTVMMMRSMTAAFLLWFLTAPSAVQVAAQDDGLFMAAESTLARANPQWWTDAAPNAGPRTIRSRLVRIDFARLDLLRAAATTPSAAAPPTLTLNLFDDIVFRARVERSTPTRSGYVLTGRLEDVPFGTLALAVNGPVVAGTVRAAGATWRIRSAGTGLHVVQQVDLSTLPPEGEPLVLPAPDASPSPAPGSGRSPIAPTTGTDPEPSPAAADGALIDTDRYGRTWDLLAPPEVVDLMVFYTPEARDAEGGTAEIEALIDLMVAETNQAFADSGVTLRLDLVRQEEVDYTEEGGLKADFGRFLDPADGHMDDVYALRDVYAVDFWHLIGRREEDDPCGQAIMVTSAGHVQYGGLGITGHDCGALTFAHELGHTMGLRHDRYVQDTYIDQPYPYSYGYLNQRTFDAGAPESSRWRTVMAYAEQCAHAGFNCTELFRFSNPDQTHNGDPLGVPGDEPSNALDGPADARRSLNNLASLFANFRNSRDRTTCKPVLTPEKQFVPAGGGTFEVTVTIHHDCAWTAGPEADFVTVTSGVSGIGSGVVSYEVAANSGSGRNSRLTISGHPFAISQAGLVSEGICDRTVQVQEAITDAAAVEHCWEVTSAHLAAIDLLDISNRHLAVLRAGDFAGLSRLRVLYLTDNELTTLPEGIFAGLSSLRGLYLRDNDLTILPEGVFAGLSSLEDLGLANNALSTLPAGIFTGLPGLRYLILDGNVLTVLAETLFGGLPRLEALLISDTPLTALPEGLLAGLSSLKSLIIRGNDLTALPDGIFAGLSSLETLWVGDNRLAALPGEIFSGLSSLENLALGPNPLRTLPDRVFAGLSRVRHLNLANTELTALPPGIFADLSGLHSLWLFDSDLTTLPAGIFSGLPGFTNLELDENPGTPFTLTLQLVQTESTATGGAVAVEVVEGAPFDMALGMSASGGTLSSDTATIGAGRTVGADVTVTRQEATVTVRPEAAPPIPHGSGCGRPRCITGLRLAVGGPVTLSGDP